MGPTSAAPADIPHCAVHPDLPAGNICGRCGGFCCEGCTTRVLGGVYCAACAVLPEVDWLETFRLKHWGKRDTLAWGLGLWGVVGLMLTLSMLSLKQWMGAGFGLVHAVVGLGCFFRQRWARVGLVALPGAVVVVAGMTLGIETIAPALLFLILGLGAVLDPRHKLFYRIPLSRSALHALWHRYENNPVARAALSFGVLGLFLPVFAPLALVLGAMGWRRVAPEARPPVGRKGQAIAAVGLGTASLLMWSFVIGPRVFN